MTLVIYIVILESWKYTWSNFDIDGTTADKTIFCRSKKKNGGKQVQLEFQTENIICDFVIIKV